MRMATHMGLLGKQRIQNRAPQFQKIIPSLILMIFISCSLWFYAWTRIQVMSLHYSIVEVSKVEKEVLQQNQKLRLKLATLKSPSRIEFIAKNQLDLKDPVSTQVIYLK
ncbi:MAG: cell division protein FtsL [Deltaproteobacteria bacterium]|nr:cell division protein FtsL [Deltaproteobacteria bacterium]